MSFFTLTLSEEAKKIEIFPKFQRQMEKTNIFKCKPPEVHFTIKDTECHIINYLLTQLARALQWNIVPRSFSYGPRCARSVLSRPQSNIPQYGPRARLVRGYNLPSFCNFTSFFPFFCENIYIFSYLSCPLLWLTAWPELLETGLALTTVNYHRNLQVSITLNQWLAQTILRATGPWSLTKLASGVSHVSLHWFNSFSELKTKVWHSSGKIPPPLHPLKRK